MSQSPRHSVPFLLRQKKQVSLNYEHKLSGKIRSCMQQYLLVYIYIYISLYQELISKDGYAYLVFAIVIVVSESYRCNRMFWV